MRRDPDLIRKILLHLEASDEPRFGKPLSLDGYSAENVNFHVMLLTEASFIESINMSSHSGYRFLPVRLTWQGYEYLEAARDNNRWVAMKKIMADTGGFIFEISKVILIKLIEEQIKSSSI